MQLILAAGSIKANSLEQQQQDATELTAA